MLARALEALARGDAPNEIAVKELPLPNRAGPHKKATADDVSFVEPLPSEFAKKLGARVGEAARFNWGWKKPGERYLPVFAWYERPSRMVPELRSGGCVSMT